MIIFHFISALTVILLYVYAWVMIVNDFIASEWLWRNTEPFTKVFLKCNLLLIIVSGIMSIVVLAVEYTK